MTFWRSNSSKTDKYWYYVVVSVIERRVSYKGYRKEGNPLIFELLCS